MTKHQTFPLRRHANSEGWGLFLTRNNQGRAQPFLREILTFIITVGSVWTEFAEFLSSMLAPHTRVTNSVIPHTNYEDQLLILETGDIRTASPSLPPTPSQYWATDQPNKKHKKPPLTLAVLTVLSCFPCFSPTSFSCLTIVNFV